MLPNLGYFEVPVPAQALTSSRVTSDQTCSLPGDRPLRTPLSSVVPSFLPRPARWILTKGGALISISGVEACTKAQDAALARSTRTELFARAATCVPLEERQLLSS